MIFRGGAVSHTVLVCDDAVFMRTVIREILGRAGYDVIGEAETGAQAVERFKELNPDLVTMDIVMPEMGGIAAVREIIRSRPEPRS
jgi:two-component system chemotaxis response regulator CheY